MDNIKFLGTGEKFSNIATQLKKECIEYLIETTKKYGLIEFDQEVDGEDICVGYDGGSHPEYASNLFSTVYSVEYDDENDELSVNIEDCDGYETEYMTASEVYTIALAVYYKMKDKYAIVETFNNNKKVIFTFDKDLIRTEDLIDLIEDSLEDKVNMILDEEGEDAFDTMVNNLMNGMSYKYGNYVWEVV